MSTVFSVSAFTQQAKTLLEVNFSSLSIEGEIASLTYHRSGHLYFTLKDPQSRLNCVMWRSLVSQMSVRLEEGMMVIVRGSVSLYAPQGSYQFQAKTIRPSGEGALSLAFEALKHSLEQRGYFDKARKRTLPPFPKRIALITAKESAGLSDMLHIIKKRWSLLEVIVLDTPVQGEGSAKMIAHTLRYANSLEVDVVVIARGGGSLEDLWAFNEVCVAEALFEMKHPTISAVGHEKDRLISDLVADVRGATPTEAMEILLPDKQHYLREIAEKKERFFQLMQQKLHHHREQIISLKAQLKQSSPQRGYEEKLQKVASEKRGFYHMATSLLTLKREQILSMSIRLEERMSGIIVQKSQKREDLVERLQEAKRQRISRGESYRLFSQTKEIALEEIEEGEAFFLVDAQGKKRMKVVCVERL